MKKFAIVRTTSKWRKHYIALPVTKRDMRRVDVPEPGMYLFSGFWYGRSGRPDFKTHRGYGKVGHTHAGCRVIGYARNSYLVWKLMR